MHVPIEWHKSWFSSEKWFINVCEEEYERQVHQLQRQGRWDFCRQSHLHYLLLHRNQWQLQRTVLRWQLWLSISDSDKFNKAMMGPQLGSSELDDKNIQSTITTMESQNNSADTNGSGVWTGISLCMRPSNEVRHYNVTSFVIGWVHPQKDFSKTMPVHPEGAMSMRQSSAAVFIIICKFHHHIEFKFPFQYIKNVFFLSVVSYIRYINMSYTDVCNTCNALFMICMRNTLWYNIRI